MNKTLRWAIVSPLWLLLSVVTAPAAAVGASAVTPGSIQGHIMDPRGYVMAGVPVTARNTETNRVYEAYTTDQVYTGEKDVTSIPIGKLTRFFFEGIEPGGKLAGFFIEGIEPGRYVVTSQYEGLERMVDVAQVEAGKISQVEFLVVEILPTGNTAIEKFAASFELHGGSYPLGNISYLNVNDSIDLYFMFAYFGILGLLSAYGFYRYRMIYLFLRYRNYKPKPAAVFAPHKLPRVTVQLPLFNEMYVAERLIDSVAALDYPRDLLEIQVLDDSTDGTTGIAAAAVKKYFDQGFHISYHHRDNREGFKAGALAAGLKKATGEFVLIFDADFTPRPDCIRRMIDYFTDERVGMVQMRWSHINADYSLLTKVQSIMLDGHFVIEQSARNRCGGFFNFNGTAGMWRREAIEWSGGWQHDTLAEDTDLSYRAQLMGWRFVYLVDDDVPSELPVEINAFKSQQRRWAKGLVQVGLKMMMRILRDPRLPLQVKLEQFFRLSGNLAAPLVIVLALINFPVLIVRYNQGLFHLFLLDVPILAFSTLSVVAFYLVAQWHLDPQNWRKSIKYMPVVMSMGIALTLSNARAVIEALLGVKSPFVRTPKYRIEESGDNSWVKKNYVKRRLSLPVVEVLFTIYFAFTIWYAIQSRIFGTI
ncbi:MAG TPA: glycosyltransferase, partial [Blastocatellia bacterium]|nr:glycosyltransferase [Blastocatellia bacterium]